MSDNDLPEPLAAIVAQRAKIVELREEAIPAETRKLAEMLAGIRDHDDPAVNPTSAARAMGVTKGYTHGLIRQLEAGEL